MKSSVTNTECWWAVEDSNLRPPRCQRLSIMQGIDLSRPYLPVLGEILTKVRKSAQVIMRKLRSILSDCSSGKPCNTPTRDS